MKPRLITIYRALIDTYKKSEKIKYDKTMLFFYIYRHLSFPIAAFFIRIGISANITTLIGFTLLISSFLIFSFSSSKFHLIALFLFLLAYIIDFVDGNIARYHSNGNFFGKLIDGFVDYISYFIFIPLSLANMSSGNSFLNNNFEIYAAISTVILAYIYMYFKLRIAFLTYELKDLNIVINNQENISNKKNLKWYLSRVSENIMTMMPILILIGFLSNNITYVILFYFIYFSVFGSLEIMARLHIFYRKGNILRSK